MLVKDAQEKIKKKKERQNNTEIRVIGLPFYWSSDERSSIVFANSKGVPIFSLWILKIKIKLTVNAKYSIQGKMHYLHNNSYKHL